MAKILVVDDVLHSDSGAQSVSPDSVIKADGLHAADDLIAVDALSEEHLVASVQLESIMMFM